MIGNLLSLAMSVTGRQSVKWERFKGAPENEAGYNVRTYYPAKNITGHVQPIPQSLFTKLGLDFSKEYVTLYTPAGVVTVDRDESGDRITYNGRIYIAEDGTDWSGQAGWSAIRCVRVKEPPNAG